MNEIIGELDPLIAPWVHYLRKRGFNTVSSCQGGRHSDHATLLPEIIIEPHREMILGIQKDNLAAAVVTWGGDGFTIQDYQDTMYQKSSVPWKEMHRRILLQFWSRV